MTDDLNARLHETALRIARELGMGGIGIVSIEASRDAANRLVEAADELTTSRATCARLQAEVNDWRQHLGDGPPSYHAAGIDMLKGDLEAWTHRAETTETERDTLRDVAFRLEAQVTTRTAALRRYGQHEASCAALTTMTGTPDFGGELRFLRPADCTCGFAAVLRAASEGAP